MIRLWCLHGNLQQPTVWDDLKAHLFSKFGTAIEVEAEDLWQTLSSSCDAWASQFSQRVQQRPDSEKQVLLGYSLGGRLAFHALVQQPALWAGAVIVAADPGLANEADRQRRLSCDRIWGQRFLTEPWEALLAEWDALPVFKGKPNLLPRPPAAFSRPLIAQMFEHYSKGHQADLRPALAALEQPSILYISGKEDTPYCHIGQQLASISPALTLEIIPEAAHRSPWENPSQFHAVLATFLTTILSDSSQFS